MDRDLWRRLRWGNIARAAGVLGVAAAVVAWPRLAPEAPRVPGPRAVPLVTVVPRDVTVVPAPGVPAPAPVRRPRERPAGRGERRAGPVSRGRGPFSRRSVGG
jgi:hypothetical protein